MSTFRLILLIAAGVLWNGALLLVFGLSMFVEEDKKSGITNSYDY